MLKTRCLPLSRSPDATVVAREIREGLGLGVQPLDIRACCAAADIEIADAPLGREGCEAMLVSSSRRIVINSDRLAPIASRDVRRHRWRFRVAHELAHTLFYASDGASLTRLSRPGTASEERFCDDFARCLLVPPPPSPVDADGLLRLQQRYDVSLELAARSVAASVDAPRVGLWWWQSTHDNTTPVLAEQWATDGELSELLGVRPFRTAPASVPDLLVAARARLGSALTTAWLPSRRQALAVLAAI